MDQPTRPTANQVGSTVSVDLTTTAVQQYLSRERTWQIEHVFANHPERHAAEVDGLTFRLARNRIGGLGLLPASDNASVRDLPFAEKTD